MTLISRPALGWNFQCSSPSGFVSMPASQHGQPQFCSGRTPGYWKHPEDRNHQWPAGYYRVNHNGHQATNFNSFFPGIPSPYPDSATFLDVLNTQGGYSGPPHNVARHIVASVLNVAKGWVPVLTIDAIRAIWSSYMNTGYYEPTAGVQWDHNAIVAYLESTMPA
jgi:hypothetical protein